MKIPDRVVDKATEAWILANGTTKDAIRKTIIAALDEWVKSGEARHGTGYPVGGNLRRWSATTESIEPSLPEDFPVLIIRMEPDND